MTRVAYGCVVALYLLLFPYHPGLRSPNELCRLWQTRALVEYGTLEINQALRDYGYVGDLSRKDGRYYPSKAPVLSFAAVPLYAALRTLGGGFRYAVPELALVYLSRLLLTVLPTLLLLVLLRRFLRAYVSEPVADAVTLTYALGSLAFSYSLLFMSHQPSAVLSFGAFYLLWRRARKERGNGAYLLAGACAGLALATEYTVALTVVLGVLTYGALSVLLDDRVEGGGRARLRNLSVGLGLATLGALPFVVALMAYHQAAFDHPLHSGYTYLNDAAYQPWHLGGFLGIRYPDPRAFFLSFFSLLRGLFVLSPFLLLAFAGLGLLRRRDRAIFWTVIALTVGYAYFTSSFSYESWGWTTGPRHLTAWVPFLLLPTALALEWARTRTLGIVAAALCGASILITGALTFVNYIPDSVSNPLGGLALPLLAEGYLPPSLPGTLLPNPWSGALMVALLCAAAALTVWRAGPSTRPVPRGAAAGALCVAWVTALALISGNTPGDLGARRHLESVWVIRPGASFDLWPAARR